MKAADYRSISRERPVLIAGPTASGKSALAQELAARDGRIVVNADALQVYGCWRVLTARPSAADEAALPHVLYGHVGREDPYSVGHWLREVRAILDRPVVIVGGTGLYFSALTKGLAEVPEVPPEVRTQADGLMRAGGHARMLAELDAETVGRLDPLNPARVQRAWEVLRATGHGLAWWQKRQTAPLIPLDQAEPLVLRPEVPWLNARIAARFSAMLDEGALDEVRAELAFWEPDRPSARAIGAAALVDYLQGKSDLVTAANLATTASQQYAKRQRTWFRSRMKDWCCVVPG